MRLFVTSFFGLAAAVHVAMAAQPQGVSPLGDSFDQLSSPFIIRDWISFARDEHERLENAQTSVHPRFSVYMLNTYSARPPAITYDPIPVWDIVTSLIDAQSTQFVPDPITSRADKRDQFDLQNMLEYEASAPSLRLFGLSPTPLE